MKVYVSINKEPIPGYLNLRQTPSDIPSVNQCEPANISYFVDDAECDELYVEGVLHHIHCEEVRNVLQHYVSKINHGGTLRITDEDFASICKAVVVGGITSEEGNKLLFGAGQNSYEFYLGSYSMRDIVGILKEFGLRILKQRINGFQFVVEGYRD